MALVFSRGTQGNPQPTAKHRQHKLHGRAYLYLKKYLGREDARRVWLAGQKIHDMEERTLFYVQAVLQVEKNVLGDNSNAGRLAAFEIYKWKPVNIRTFICDPYFLNKKTEIYPNVLIACEELNSGKYVEAVLTGGIGSGKTTIALYTNAYQLYLLSCMRNPHGQFGLDPSSEIILIFQNITKQLAMGVDYQRFRHMIEGSRYFAENFPFNRDLISKLIFPNRIEVAPVAGSETAAIGQNVMGGLIDELNYMAVVEKSKTSVDKGTYDQAVAVYNSISRRRKSRFMEAGKLPGILCLVSSKKYPGQFTDLKMEEARKDPTIYVYDKRVWDIKPDSFAHKGWFHVFSGDMTRKPRILGPEEGISDIDRHLVVSVPEEFRVDFEKDVINALREVAGMSTMARHPFFLEVDKVNKVFRKDISSIFSQSPIDFVEKRLRLLKNAFFKPELPRFIHIDLAISGDSAGMAIGTCVGFRQISADEKQSTFMPIVRMDGVLEIRPPKNSEILFSKIREVLLALKRMGMNVRWVTFDQFQSTDSQQILRQQGFVTGHQSIDDTPCRPYDFMKSAMYEERLFMPEHPHVQKEILMLEKDTKTGKVDHPPAGSKDCADAVAGVLYGLTMRREIWALYKIPLMMVPAGILLTKETLEKKNEVRGETEYQKVEG